MRCLGLPPVHAIGGAATVITTRIADSVDRVKPKSKSGDSGCAAAPMKLIAADESHTESESDSRAGRPLRLTPAVGEEVDSSYSSYSDSDYEHPAVGGVAAPEVSIPAVRDSSSDCNSERDYDTHRRQRAKKGNWVTALVELLQHRVAVLVELLQHALPGCSRPGRRDGPRSPRRPARTLRKHG